MINTSNAPDRTNIQGLILRGYTHPFSCHLLFSFLNDNKATVNTKTFFADLYPKVQSATEWGNNKPVSMLNIGLTYLGIQQLNFLAANELANFPSSFKNGPWSGGSQASLGDIYDTASDPSKWWNSTNGEQNTNLHCVVHIYALTQEALETLVNAVLSSASTNGLTEIIPLTTTTNGGRLYQCVVENDPEKIHFGYTDGISEPSMQDPPLPWNPITETNSAETNNNFLIGYPNSLSNPGPTDTDTNTCTVTASSFAKDGCYNAFRVIYQDVAAFNSFLQQSAQSPEIKKELAYLNLTEQETEEWVAAKLCGRWRNGSPLMLSPEKPDPATSHGEDFKYGSTDDSGKTEYTSSSLRCPFSAHTRAANPRDQPLLPSEGVTTPPRILRRGVPYGEALPNSSTTDDGVDRGLVGLFLCGSIAGQFEKLYSWMNYNNFSDKTIFNIKHPPQDALLGNRNAANSNAFPGAVKSFTIPLDNGTPKASITIPAMPQFLTTRGTAYCLLPSLANLAKIAGLSK
jgi:deferrochelatase/peroxidase EfeB